MRNDTRLKFNHYTAEVARINNVGSADVQFTVDPAPAQALEEKVQLSSEFLGRINIQPVIDQTGEAIGLSVVKTIAGRTNVSGTKRRQPQDPTGLTKNTYSCVETEFDIALPYKKIDAWARFDDFPEKWANACAQAIALNRIMIGWNGDHIAEDTNRETYPLLQDVNIGWLEKIRTRAPERHMKEIVKDSGKVTVGKGGDYENLDALVQDTVNDLIDEVHQDATDLVVICGRQLLNDKNFAIVNKDQDNQNVLAGQILIGQKQIGGLPSARVPYFPENAFLITSFDNLSIYYQEDAKRRFIREEPDAKRVADYQSSNEDYVIEAYEKVAFVENIEIL
ncbi:phage major capsid protein, P2 family [Acinetobacter bereziniae]|uniref:phage major capsid protein, P2 family n=1 Tax=Acinetobacter bereziniae TaxID=106648 RepID=UPI0019006D8D|nr:phage major capsid protein, P2 family [Acinetobacter bereziniae]MBJ8475332.1 phage major capsid protein, P2 family [Acinetobacter bereziniae]MCU4317129.1 phage major capsid protein, P2 family [Acinetobacter bereziniae]MCV2441879.1 phage major capsid protein, P2 family [Acinetobacter bereziniae]